MGMVESVVTSTRVSLTSETDGITLSYSLPQFVGDTTTFMFLCSTIQDVIGLQSVLPLPPNTGEGWPIELYYINIPGVPLCTLTVPGILVREGETVRPVSPTLLNIEPMPEHATTLLTIELPQGAAPALSYTCGKVRDMWDNEHPSTYEPVHHVP